MHDTNTQQPTAAQQLAAAADAAANVRLGRMPVTHEHVVTLGCRGGLIPNLQAS